VVLTDERFLDWISWEVAGMRIREAPSIEAKFECLSAFTTYADEALAKSVARLMSSVKQAEIFMVVLEPQSF
jgi:hypothetical protein